jgi:N-acetyl-anhydromuramyl-L-alanine amidase AmpD
MRFLAFWLGGAVIAAIATGSAWGAQKSVPPEIVSRSAWAAKPPNTALMRSQSPREIVIHHTAEKQQPQQTLQEKLQKLQKFSQNPGKVGAMAKPAWGDVPYHFYVDLAGRIGEGRNVNFAGDTNTRYDTANRIQIVLEGNFDLERPMPEQLKSLDRLVLWLAAKYRVPASKIAGHNDHVATTECPGRNLKRYLAVLRRKVAAAR